MSGIARFRTYCAPHVAPLLFYRFFSRWRRAPVAPPSSPSRTSTAVHQSGYYIGHARRRRRCAHSSVPRKCKPNALSFYDGRSRCCRCSSPAAAGAGQRLRNAGSWGARQRSGARWRNNWHRRRDWFRRQSRIAESFGSRRRCRRRLSPRSYRATAARHCTSSHARSSSSATSGRSRPFSVSKGFR